jgi:hypothetical protein
MLSGIVLAIWDRQRSARALAAARAQVRDLAVREGLADEADELGDARAVRLAWTADGAAWRLEVVTAAHGRHRVSIRARPTAPTPSVDVHLATYPHRGIGLPSRGGIGIVPEDSALAPFFVCADSMAVLDATIDAKTSATLRRIAERARMGLSIHGRGVSLTWEGIVWDDMVLDPAIRAVRDVAARLGSRSSHKRSR